MEKDQIIEKLADLGIVTTNCYPKSSFVKNGDVHIGLYKRELGDDFYFFNNYDKKIYHLPKQDDIDKYEKDDFKGTIKYLIPLYECKMIWEDKAYTELPDTPYKDMTLRQYACIMLRIPNSNLEWLDVLIKQANNKSSEVNI